MTMLWVSLLCLAGALVQGVTGIGFSMTLMSFLPLAIPYAMAANINRLVGLTVSVYALWRWRRHLRWRLALVPTLTSLALSATGITVFAGMDEGLLKKLLGLFLLFMVGLTAFLQKRHVPVRPTLLNGMLFGALAGFVSGLFSILGPILAIYYLSTTASTDEYKATLHLNFVVLSVWNNIFYAACYGYTAQELILSAAGTGAAVLAVFLACRFLYIKNRQMVTGLMLAVTGIMALSMLV